MTNGTSQGLFIVIAIVIFGIFVGLSQTLFGKQLTNDLVTLFEQSTEQATFDKNKDYNVEDAIPSDESDFIFDGVNKIIGYKGSSTEVVIPNEIDNKKVTSISGDAFNNKGITKLIMPNSLTTIEDGTLKDAKVVGAFANNTIEEISFSANLKYIGSFAFFNGELDDVILPEGLKSIGESAFEEDNLSKINIPATVENIGDNAFKDNNITEVNYANNSLLKNIGSNVFSGNNIESLKLPSGITTIKENAYSNSGLKNVTIPNDTQVIGKDAFSNNDLTFVEIPAGVTEIHENAFSNNQLTNVSIPSTVEKIGKNSFSNNKLTEVTIPENVKEIEEGSFKENELTNVDLQEGLESIGDYAFYKNQLPVINLPESVINIGTYAFYENKLTNVKIPSKLSVIKEWSFAYNIMTEKPIIPINIIKEEENAFYGNLFKEKNPDYPVDVTKITSEKSFSFNTKTKTITNYTGYETNVVIPATINGVDVEHIGEYAFNRFKNNYTTYNVTKVDLTSIVIPNSVKTIGKGSFQSNSNYLVSGSQKLSTIILGDSVTDIGMDAFRNHLAKSIVIPDNVVTIGDGAFEISGTNSTIESITLGNSVKYIGKDAFSSTKITSLEIPESVRVIGDSAFRFNSNLKDITIYAPKYLIDIAPDAFWYPELIKYK